MRKVLWRTVKSAVAIAFIMLAVVAGLSRIAYSATAKSRLFGPLGKDRQSRGRFHVSNKPNSQTLFAGGSRLIPALRRDERN